MTRTTEIEDAARWLRRLGEPPGELEPLAGDVSPRRYFRLRRPGGGTAVLACYPQASRDACRRWLATSALLAGAGVRVPRVLAADCGAGFMLVEDLGPETLYDRRLRPWPELLPVLGAAAETAARIARLAPGPLADVNPPLDAALLARELDQTWDLVLEAGGLCGPPALAARLHRSLDLLVEALAAPPPVPCHRDFMARNLVPLPDGEVAVLDHQDLRLGPPHYDLASLLNDSLYPPPAIEEELTAPWLTGADDRLGYHRAAAQRALKIAGTFEAFRRRGDARHAPLIAPSLAAALRHLGALPETAALAVELAPHWRAADLC